MVRTIGQNDSSAMAKVMNELSIPIPYISMVTESESLANNGESNMLVCRLCSTGLPSDVVVEVGEMSFHLHKFPLLSRSGVLENLIAENCSDDEKKCVLQLNDIPGGAKMFLLVAKFCYGVKIELNALNIVSLRCAAEFLQMNEDFGEANLINQTENFFNDVFGNWLDTVKVLEACEEVLPKSEELQIVTRCINSLAVKACQDPSLLSWPVSGRNSLKGSGGTILWNGIRTTAKTQPVGDDWWYEDVSFLRFPLYKRLILAVGSRGMKPDRIAGSLVHYAKRYLPLMGRELSHQCGNRAAPGSTFSILSELDQKNLLEEIVELLPDEKGVTPTKFLLRLLRTSMVLHASPSCREILEKQIGAQLDQAALEDLLIPNMGYSVETLYDIDCIQRILDHFMVVDRDITDPSAGCIIEDGQLMGGHSLTPMTMVANLVDGYLAEVAPDVNLKLPKFQSLAAVIPDYARPLDDGIYRAIDIYLKAHPWLTDSEKEQICRLMNCQKLSLEASTHAAQNERLPLRVIVQVLFFEQLRLRTSIAGWFFVSDNLENSQHPSGNLAFLRNDGSTQAGTGDKIVAVDDMRERVLELEKECISMKQELERLVKTKGNWSIFFKKFGLKLRSQTCEAKTTKTGKLRVSSPSKTQPENGVEDQNQNNNVCH
ncbi:NPH3 domain [Dillenia turbinata]|uniref:NPH3 domain n=1 Tax=Dillenia turbinata TaxID=194707 RepID=A0AAN8VFN0_9MAGN